MLITACYRGPRPHCEAWVSDLWGQRRQQFLQCASRNDCSAAGLFFSSYSAYAEKKILETEKQQELTFAKKLPIAADSPDYLVNLCGAGGVVRKRKRTRGCSLLPYSTSAE